MDVVPFGKDTGVILFPNRLLEWNRVTGGKRLLKNASQTGLGVSGTFRTHTMGAFGYRAKRDWRACGTWAATTNGAIFRHRHSVPIW